MTRLSMNRPSMSDPSTPHRAGFVSILGRPNAGKSTLLNALVGQKLAIVASRPQTTRTSIQGVLTLPEAQIVFLDTPGIHKSDTLLNKHMMNTVRASMETDVVLFLIDALAPFREEDAHALDLVKKLEAPVLAIFNKVDALVEKPRVLALIERYRSLHEFADYIPVSAMKADGLDVLRAEIVKRLPEGPALFPEEHVTDQPERFMVAEILREKILHLTGQEVPHAVAVMIENWEDTPKLLRVQASIYVERPGQKTIVIGAGGAGLKKIGTLARQEMEQMFGKKVFLQTFVKVRPRWREDPEFLAASDWRRMVGN
jgi:GTP-binding protein Era